jgi:lipopolysaccharide heptosyltransferase II
MAMSVLKRALKEIVRAPVESTLKVYLSTLSSGRTPPARIKSILVFAYHGLGNFIMYTPALRLLRESFPTARIDLQVGNNTGCEEVLADAGLFDNIYNLPFDRGTRAWVSRAYEIRQTGYDVTVNEFHSHSWRLAMLVAFARAPWRVGHVTSPGWSRRFSRFSFVFNIPVTMSEDEHEVDRYLDLIRALGAPRVSHLDARPFIHLGDKDRDFAREFFNAPALSAAGTIIGIQPGTSETMRWKQWPVERYRELIKRVLDDCPGAHVVLFGSANERSMIEELVKGLGPRSTVAAGKTTVKQVAALIEKCDMLVCNDSGLMHVAVAVGTPVVAIYGPTDLARTAPRGEGHIVIRHELPCSPCFRLEGDEQIHRCTHHDCLMTIAPEEVIHAVEVRGRETGKGKREKAKT